ncbi:unnamed protein product [Rhodiola kirilowii]
MELCATAAKSSIVAVSGVLLALLLLSASAREEERIVSRIAFGSCANQSAPQPIWDAINGFNPQLFIWLGDNIYGDNKRPFRVFGKERTIGPWKNVPRFVPATEQEMVSKYEKAKSNPGYTRLRKSAKGTGDVRPSLDSLQLELEPLGNLSKLVGHILGIPQECKVTSGKLGVGWRIQVTKTFLENLMLCNTVVLMG